MRFVRMLITLRVGCCLGLWILSWPASAAERTVTVRTPQPQPLVEVVRLIAEQSGVPVRVEGETLARVSVDLEERSVAQALALVARLARMQVQPEGEGFVLKPLAPAPAPEPAGPVPTPASEVIARVKPHVALVVASVPAERASAQGTAFSISVDGLLVTNYHVVRGASMIYVVFPDNTAYFAVVAAHDENQDLAILRVDARFKEHLRLGDSDQAREGDDVALTGYPMALELLKNGITLYSSTAKCTVNAVRPGKGMNNEETSFIQIDAPVNPGSSGGPLFRLDTGQVIGVVQAKIAYDQAQDSGVSLAIPINAVRPLIKAARANPVAPPTDQEIEKLSAAIPATLRAQSAAPTVPVEPASEVMTAITRPFELLPAEPSPSIPEPAAAPGLIPLYAPGGRMLADPTRPRLYVADFGGNSVCVIDTTTGQLVRRIFTGSKPYGLAIASDGRTLYVANSGGSELFLLDLEKLTPLGLIPLSFRPFDLVLGPGERLFVTSSGPARTQPRMIDLRRQIETGIGDLPLEGGAILAASTETGFVCERVEAPTPLFEIAAGRLTAVQTGDAGSLGAGIQDLFLSPDGKRLYVASRSLGYVSVLDAQSYRPLGQLDVGGAPGGIALSPDGATAYVWQGKARIDRFDTRTFLRTGTLALSTPALRVVTSADGARLFIQVAGGIQVERTDAFAPPRPESTP